MRYYALEPEVAGGLGENAVMDRSVHPPLVSRLHYRFDGWSGDELVETFPCFLVTDSLSARFVSAELTGFELADVEVTTGEQYLDSGPAGPLPVFRWLQVTGAAERDDFGIGDDLRLVVSARALDIIRSTSPVGLNVESM